MNRYALHHLWRPLLIALALLPIGTLPPASIKATPAVSLHPIGLQATTVLYDGALNTGTPDTQGFLYLTNPLSGAQATQTFTNPVTTLDTTPQRIAALSSTPIPRMASCRRACGAPMSRQVKARR